MYPDVEKCEAAITAAREARMAAAAAPGLPEGCDFAVDPEDCPRCKALAAPDAALGSALADAFDALKASADPLVRWIAENCKDYRSEVLKVLKVLKALPATLAELDALAERERWCGDYRMYRRAALKAGVLSTPAEPEASPDPVEGP